MSFTLKLQFFSHTATLRERLRHRVRTEKLGWRLSTHAQRAPLGELLSSLNLSALIFRSGAARLFYPGVTVRIKRDACKALKTVPDTQEEQTVGYFFSSNHLLLKIPYSWHIHFVAIFTFCVSQTHQESKAT